MTTSDADRWNAKYAAAEPRPTANPHALIVEVASLWDPGRWLDIACGLGADLLHAAEHGFIAAGVDVSSVAVQAVESRAAARGLFVDVAVLDVTSEAIPAGPWNVISCVHYLDRPLLGRLAESLAPGGHLVAAIATRTNLETHERPSARFLLEPGELSSLVPELTVVRFDEAWRSNGAHEAWLIAQASGGG